MQPVTVQEKAKMLAFLEERAQQDFMEVPLKKMSEFLLHSFGWPLSQGRKRAIEIVEALKRFKVIDYEYKDGKLARGIKIRVLGNGNSNRQTPTVRLVKPEEEKVVEIPKLEPEKPRRKFKIQKRGVARSKRESEVVGERNESRLHKLAIELSEILCQNFKETILHAGCTRSGHHNPKKGKINLQDSAGNDVDIRLDIKDSEGRMSSRWLIWDAKTSAISAARFNQKIIYFPGQTGADLKKAIVVNKYRSDHEIIVEIASDLLSVGALTEDMKNRISELVADH